MGPCETYKTKLITFSDRPFRIVLQNGNGPCSLLAICNVLLLRGADELDGSGEVSLDRLLDMIMNALLDSDPNLEVLRFPVPQVRSAEHWEKIDDAMWLLPSLAEGMNVNVLFRKIDDFERTPIFDVFDLLGIRLYHGWIVDPQDKDTAWAIGYKSYNTLVEELVSFERLSLQDSLLAPEDSIDSSSGTDVVSGNPRKRANFFPDTVQTNNAVNAQRRGHLEEAADIYKALELSKFDKTCIDISSSKFDKMCIDESSSSESLWSYSSLGSDECTTSGSSTSKSMLEPLDGKEVDSYKVSHPPPMPLVRGSNCPEDFIYRSMNGRAKEENAADDFTASYTDESKGNPSQVNQSGSQSFLDNITLTGAPEKVSIPRSDVSCSSRQPASCSDQSPSALINEGKAVSAEQDGSLEEDSSYTPPVDCMSGEKYPRADTVGPKEVQLIQAFLESSSGQLTKYGLFCLQEGILEKELCIFFQNNHFSTMYKFQNELYLLVTDQGYLGQTDLVWEKLNMVNGDTVFMTGSFQEFRIEKENDASWTCQSC